MSGDLSLRVLIARQDLQRHSHAFSLPWEDGYAGEVFRSRRTQWFERPSSVGIGDFVTNSSNVVEPLASDALTWPRAAKRITMSPSVQTDDDLRFKALSMVKILLQMDLTATDLGTTLGQVARFTGCVCKEGVVDSLQKGFVFLALFALGQAGWLLSTMGSRRTEAV